MTRTELPAPVVLGAAYLAGSIPFSHLVAQRVRGVDLRTVGSGTVSGTGVFRSVGFAAGLGAGIADLLKGSVGPSLAGRHRPYLAAAAGGLGVAGHNWSPFLRGAGGRGISTAMGAMWPTTPVGSGLLLTGLAVGRGLGESAVGCLIADVALVPVSRLVGGPEAAAAAGAVVVPMLAKRVAGNGPAPTPRWRTRIWRLLLDRDSRI
ncbi:MAG: glycerol-3-phosphate acyltransferase [Actinomycetes bacterium]